MDAANDTLSADAERAGMLAALHAVTVGLISTLKRKGLLSGEEVDQLFAAGVATFERGEPDETRMAAIMTLQILARSLAGPEASSAAPASPPGTS